MDRKKDGVTERWRDRKIKRKNETERQSDRNIEKQKIERQNDRDAKR